ncbi:MAG: hypothetical protein CL840_21350 [Crocinitomicaceae bacterium]|nr:hypothetical protein [Crocinitomicaceae bacterium]
MNLNERLNTIQSHLESATGLIETKTFITQSRDSVARQILSSDYMDSIDLGETGHSYIVDETGRMVFYDNRYYYHDTLLIDSIANSQKDGGNLGQFIDSIVKGHNSDTAGRIRYLDQTLSNKWQWRVFSRRSTTNWTTVIIFNEEELPKNWNWFITIVFLRIFCITICLISLSYLLINFLFNQIEPNGKRYYKKYLGSLSASVSFCLLVGLSATLVAVNYNNIRIFEQKNRHKTAVVVEYPGVIEYLKKSLKIEIEKLDQVTDSPAVHLDNHMDDLHIGSDSAKTVDSVENHEFYVNEDHIHQLMVQINSMDLVDANYIKVSGTIAVKYAKRHSQPKFALNTAPFYFPDGVEQQIQLLDSGWKTIPAKISQNGSHNYHVTDWKFSVKLYQILDYRFYPFDVQQLKLRIQHIDRDKDFFIPDFDNIYNHAVAVYDKAKETDSSRDKDNLFILNKSIDKRIQRINQGINNDLELSDWKIEDAHYQLGKTAQLSSISDGFGTTPEFVQAVHIKRKLLGPMISNFLLLFIISMILFILVLLMEKIKDAGNLIGAYVGLFFTLLLSHFKLREDLQFHAVVYIEWYYFILYLMLMVLIVYRYLHQSDINLGLLEQNNSLMVKILFWPFLLGSLLIFTMSYFLVYW